MNLTAAVNLTLVLSTIHYGIWYYVTHIIETIDIFLGKAPYGDVYSISARTHCAYLAYALAIVEAASGSL